MLATRLRETRISFGTLAGLSSLALLSAILVQFPTLVFGLVLTVAVFAVLWHFRPPNLDLWKGMVLTALTFYIILNYGFENLAFRVGPVPVIVGESLMIGAFGIVIWRYRLSVLKRVAIDPPFICLLILLGLAVLHLLWDVPRFGLYAFRDASIFVEGLFFFLGSIWARDEKNTQTLLHWLVLVLLGNMLYNALFPLSLKLQSLSPNSGVFQKVPIIGHFQDSPLFLVAGALFFLWLGRRVTGMTRGLLWFFAVIQLGELGILQTRSAYVGLGLILLLLLVFGEVRKARQVTGVVLAGLLALVVLIEGVAVLGVTIPGRVGPVDFGFLEEQAKSVFSVGKPGGGMEDDADRKDWYGQVWRRITASPVSMLWGEGFGEPLIDFRSYSGERTGIAVRQPHNSTLSVLARLGLLGLAVWMIFHFLILRSFYKGLRARSLLDDVSGDLLLWLLCLYLLFMVTASVQPLLEFSHGAVPFYFLMGFALGIVRWRVEGRGVAPWRACEGLSG